MSQSQHQPSHTSPAGPPGQPQLSAMADRLEALRVALATRLEPDELAELQAAVVELASMAGRPPGIAQPVPTPTSTPAPPPPAPSHKGS